MEILSPNSARLVSIIRNAFFESNAVKSVELYENSYSEAEEKGVYLNPLHVYLFFRDGILDGVSNLAVTLTFDADMCTECEFTIEGEKANDWRKHTRDVKKFITPAVYHTMTSEQSGCRPINTTVVKQYFPILTTSGKIPQSLTTTLMTLRMLSKKQNLSRMKMTLIMICSTQNLSAIAEHWKVNQQRRGMVALSVNQPKFNLIIQSRWRN